MSDPTQKQEILGSAFPLSESRIKEIVGELVLSRAAVMDLLAAKEQENAALRQAISAISQEKQP